MPGRRPSTPLTDCSRCGGEVTLLRRPIRRLRWTRHFWRGVGSLIGDPLRFCRQCGSLYTHAGELIAAGAAETEDEMKARGFRDDMVGLRDGFGTVIIASEASVLWTLLGPIPGETGTAILVGSIGIVALVPFTYFAKKASRANREFRELRAARRRGEVGP